MSKRIVLVKPEAPARPMTGKLTRRLPALEGLRLGVLYNSKANGDHLLRDIAESLETTYGLRLAIWRQKPAASFGATEEILDELAREADLVVTAMGD
jgi:hypothetical protein